MPSKIGVTCIRRDYGDMVFLRGETDRGEVLRDFDWRGNFKDKKIHVVKGLWFQSRRRDYVRSTRANAHFVAKASAVPESETFDPCKDIVWVSGQKTWRELAKRGIWVHGSSESFGEREEKRINLLVQTPLFWLKWTHSQAPGTLGMESVATYDLVPGKEIPDISELKSHGAFYWRSGSQFQRAVKKDPKLLECEHFCGPGNTFTLISEVLRKKNIKRKPKIIPVQWVFGKD